jgi:hypothetical protein
MNSSGASKLIHMHTMHDRRSIDPDTTDRNAGLRKQKEPCDYETSLTATVQPKG